MVTNTEIRFLPVDESHTHALSPDTKHLSYRRLFSNTVKPRGCISWSVWRLRGINKAAWDGMFCYHIICKPDLFDLHDLHDLFHFVSSKYTCTLLKHFSSTLRVLAGL